MTLHSSWSNPYYTLLAGCITNPNSITHHQTSQKLSPKHAARGVAQSPYPIYRHRKACLSKQPPWRAAGDPRLARGRSRVRAPGPAGALRVLFFSTLPSFLLREIVFFCTFPTKPTKVLGLYGFVYKLCGNNADAMVMCCQTKLGSSYLLCDQVTFNVSLYN